VQNWHLGLHGISAAKVDAEIVSCWPQPLVSSIPSIHPRCSRMTSCKETESRSSADVENDRAGVNIKHWCYIQPAQYHYNMMATNDFYWRTLEKYTWRVHWCWYASPEVLLIDMRSMLRVRKDQGCPEFPPGGFDLPLLRCLSPKFAFALIRLHMSFCSSCYLSAGLLNLCNHVHHKSCKQVACVSWTHHAYYWSPKKKTNSKGILY